MYVYIYIYIYIYIYKCKSNKTNTCKLLIVSYFHLSGLQYKWSNIYIRCCYKYTSFYKHFYKYS